MASLEKIYQDAVAALQSRRFQDAENLFKQFLKRQPKNFGALSLLTSVLLMMNRHADAEKFASEATRLDKNSYAAAYNYGLILKKLGKPDLALKQFEQALRLNPKDPDAWMNRGVAYSELKNFDAAISDFDEAISLNGKFADAHYNKGNALFALGRTEDALAAFQASRDIQPAMPEAWLGSGNVLLQLKKYEDAIAAFDKAVALNPRLAGAWLGRGNALYLIKRHGEALAAFENAVAADASLPAAWLGKGNALVELLRLDEAVAAYQQAIALDPNSAEAWGNLGSAYLYQNRNADAVKAYDKAFAIKDDLSYLPGMRLFAKMSICDWDNFSDEREKILTRVRAGDLCTSPFSLISISSSAREQFDYATAWTAKHGEPQNLESQSRKQFVHEKIRVAYVSADFREHAVSYLLAGVLEAHDRTRFEITAISLSHADSPMRRRLENAFDHFIEVQQQPDAHIAALMREREIDIAIDLMGYTAGSRRGIFSARAAPIQMALLGYPATLGTSDIDYLAADDVLIPEHDRANYAEKIIYLPDGPMPSDDKHRIISAKIFDRQELGLPQDAFVYCCFNNSYKINPDVLDCWMRILTSVENSVLWLSANSDAAMENLKKEVKSRGVSPDRILFAPRMPSAADHLARHRAADLFLDTSPYNAHTTTSDALWAGLPVLTHISNAFAGRVAASLLTAVGLPELITHSQSEYEDLAISLAKDPQKLSALKDRLAKNRNSASLFKTQTYTENLEKAYAAIHSRYKDGQPPGHIHIG